MPILGVPTKVIAACLALSAFAVAIIAGLSAGNPARTVLFNAVVSMIVCQVVGLFAGQLAERAVAEHVASYRAARTIPGSARPRDGTQGHPGALPEKKSDLG